MNAVNFTNKVKKTEIKKFIRDIPDFPKQGIIFKDITPLLKHKAAFKKTIDVLAGKYRKENVAQIVAVESRGFIFGAAFILGKDAMIPRGDFSSKNYKDQPTWSFGGPIAETGN